jgi:hypothetical protein
MYTTPHQCSFVLPLLPASLSSLFSHTQVELMEVVDFFRKPEKFRASGARPPKGVLLVGPPGACVLYVCKQLACRGGAKTRVQDRISVEQCMCGRVWTRPFRRVGTHSHVRRVSGAAALNLSGCLCSVCGVVDDGVPQHDRAHHPAHVHTGS